MFYALVAMCLSCSQDVRIIAPTVEHQENPEALSTDKPRFSWKIESDRQDVLQESYRIGQAGCFAGKLQDIGFFDKGGPHEK